MKKDICRNCGKSIIFDNLGQYWYHIKSSYVYCYPWSPKKLHSDKAAATPANHSVVIKKEKKYPVKK